MSVTREEVFRICEMLESEGINALVQAADVLRRTWADRVEFECASRPKWNGGFEAARKIAWNILDTCRGPRGLNDFDNMAFVEKLSEALVEAYDSGVAAEHNALHDDPNFRIKILADLLWHYGIGIASLERMEARTIAIARGELKPVNEPKLWFTSIETLVEHLQRLDKQIERLQLVTACLLDHYLDAYNGNIDRLSSEAQELIPDWKEKCNEWRPRDKSNESD